MTPFWQTCINYANELQVGNLLGFLPLFNSIQNMLSKHHLDLGVEQLVTSKLNFFLILLKTSMSTGISDVENRIALRNIVQ